MLSRIAIAFSLSVFPAVGTPVQTDWGADWQTVNAPEFISAVETFGPGSGNLNLPDSARLMRWKVWSPNVAPGLIVDDNGTLRVTYQGNSDWPPLAEGPYAYIHYIGQVDGRYISHQIATLIRPANDTEVVIQGWWTRVDAAWARHGMARSTGLGAIWIGSSSDAGKTDLYPWRR